MAAVTRARPLARCCWAWAVRSCSRPRRWKHTARARALRDSPLFSSAVACRRSRGRSSQSRTCSVRSMRPISRSASAKPFLPRVGAEPLEQQRSADRARPHRGRHAEHVVPLRRDQLVVGLACDERRQRRPRRGRGQRRRACGRPGWGCAGANRNPNRCANANTWSLTPSAICVMDGDAEVGLMVERPVDDVGRLARGRGWTRCGTERAGPKHGCRTAQRLAPMAMPGVVSAQRLAAPCGQECLAVGAGHVGGPWTKRPVDAVAGR